jgi:hypothetical protein
MRKTINILILILGVNFANAQIAIDKNSVIGYSTPLYFNIVPAQIKP